MWIFGTCQSFVFACEIEPTVDGNNCAPNPYCMCVGCKSSLEHDIISLGGFTEGGRRQGVKTLINLERSRWSCHKSNTTAGPIMIDQCREVFVLIKSQNVSKCKNT